MLAVVPNIQLKKGMDLKQGRRARGSVREKMLKKQLIITWMTFCLRKRLYDEAKMALVDEAEV